MKLRKLFEEDINLDPAGIAANIARDCKPFLTQSGFDPEDPDTALFRGQAQTPALFRKFQSRVRQPSDSAIDIHNALDAGLAELTGIKYRSTGVFTSGDTQEAGSYGKPCLFFPIKEFSFCWSSSVADAYTMFDIGYLRKEPRSVLAGLIKSSYVHDHDDYLDELEKLVALGGAGYQTDNLPRAIASKHEVMLSCKEYYLLDHCRTTLGWDEPNGAQFNLVMKELGKLL